MPHTVLIVDDDAAVLKMLKRHLENRSYHVLTAGNGAEALIVVNETRPDLVLSDVEMPVLDGPTLCRVLRQETVARPIPLILMSGAQIEENNILAGFERGADDYVLKPCSLAVLTARIEAVIRRYETVSQTAGKLHKGAMELDPEGRSITISGKKISLTRKEFDLLTQLVSKAGRVLSVPYLLESIWGYDPSEYNDPRTVETHISCLRKKLGPDIGKRIVNLTGHGYKFEDF